MVHKDPEGYISASDSGSEFDDQDNDFGDWRSDDSNPPAPTVALFADSNGQKPHFDTAVQALDHAKSSGCDFVALVKRLDLDTLQVIRLINHIRRNNLNVHQVNNIAADSNVLSDDDELKPVAGFEDDGLLQLDFDLISVPCSNMTAPADAGAGASVKAASSENARIKELEEQLATARSAFDELRSIHASTLGLSRNELFESAGQPLSLQQRSSLASSSLHSARTTRGANDKEDDVLYFDSYSTNSIHQTMITDTARTLSYAQFLLHPSNSHLIRGKVVMDVGCGSGILSLFAARAGAKRVIAIDASDIVERAKQNVEANHFGHVVKVYKGKLEELEDELRPYQGKVDMLVSEWMGYFLLYENMLPSVLVARDRYLNKQTGVLAPNRMTMHLAAFSSQPLLQTKLKFWDSVHGFDMKSMTTGLLDEAFVDVLDKDEVVSDSFIFGDFNLVKLPVKQPEPHSEFELTITHDLENQQGEIHGFISWFDTFFFPSANVPENGSTECSAFTLTEGDVMGMDLVKDQITPSFEGEGKGKEDGHLVCFSTSPFSKETHWQQTLFVLKQAITGVKKGDKIKGKIVVLQDQKHSRQLECELYYLHVPKENQTVVTKEGTKSVNKRVETMAVQMFMVR